MNASLLFIIASDPRQSGRPGEAVRIAAGLSVWKKVNVSVYARGAATLIYAPGVEPLVDEHDIDRYLPVLRESGGRLLAQQGADVSVEQVEQVDDDALARISAQADHVLRF